MLGRRPDGTLAKVAPYRRLMPFLMPGRNESAVSFDQLIEVAKTEAFLAEHNSTHPDLKASLFHVVTWAVVRTLHQRPRMNRFVAGGKIWDRDGIWLSYAAKKRKLAEDAPLVVIKRRFDPSWDFAQLVRFMSEGVSDGRSDRRSASDRETSCLLALPGCGTRAALGLVRLLDRWGLLPRAVLDTDPLHASVFLANLGSLNMDAASHHLYEWGTTPLFCVIGRVKDVPVVRDGQVVAARTALLRWTFDERIEDGLYAQRSLEVLRGVIEDPSAVAD